MHTVVEGAVYEVEYVHLEILQIFRPALGINVIHKTRLPSVHFNEPDALNDLILRLNTIILLRFCHIENWLNLPLDDDLNRVYEHTNENGDEAYGTIKPEPQDARGKYYGARYDGQSIDKVELELYGIDISANEVHDLANVKLLDLVLFEVG